MRLARIRVVPWVALCAISLGASLSMAFWWDDWWNPLNDTLRMFPAMAGTLAVAIASGAVVVRRLGRIAGLRQEGDRVRNIIGGTARSLRLALVGIAVAFLSQAVFINRVDLARRSYDHYAMSADEAGRTLTIEGVIGPGLASLLRRNLELHPAIDTFVITSAGGLTDQALAAADAIGQVPGATVIARARCDSSCIIVLMAGERRQADWDLEFGFHAASSIVEEDFDRWDLLAPKRAVDDYLLGRGLPDELAFRSFAGEELTMVPAIRLAQARVLHGLLDGDEPVPVTHAKWRKMETLLALGGAGQREVLVPLLQAIRESNPEAVGRHADLFHDSLEKGDHQALGAAIGDLMLDLVASTLLAANDSAVNGYQRAQQRRARNLAAAQRWDECARHAAGDVSFGIPGTGGDDAGQEYAALGRAIASARRAGWKPRHIPDDTGRLSQEVVARSLVHLRDLGLDHRDLGRDARTNCVFSLARHRFTLGLGARHAADLARWRASRAKEAPGP